MFKSYEYYHLDYDPKTNTYRWEYKIVDDDWVAVGVVVAAPVAARLPGGAAVIQEYSKRDLPIAANLVRAFQWQSKKYGVSIEQIIAWNKQYSPKFKQYEQDIERYMVLL
jgi:hypothetical protein